MIFEQTTLTLPAKSRGFHLISESLVQSMPALKRCKVGILHVFMQHTSASLTLNENADPSVRRDFERAFNHLVPENESYYEHVDEGPDDMPAHIKASLLGASVSIPVTNGELNVGTWQGIYLCEHRDYGGPRTLVLTLQGN